MATPFLLGFLVSAVSVVFLIICLIIFTAVQLYSRRSTYAGRRVRR